MQSPHSCGICLNTHYILIKSNDLDANNVSWAKKLKTFIPEIDWNDENFICKPCANQIEIAVMLRELCLNTQNILLKNMQDSAVPLDGYSETPYKLFDSNESNDLDDSADVSDDLDDSKPLSDFLRNNVDESSCNPLKKADCNDEDYCPNTVKKKVKRKRDRKQKERDSNLSVREYKSYRFNNEFDCEICNAKYTSVKELIQHIKTHNLDSRPIKPYKCPECNSRFGTAYHLRRHIHYHDKKRTHICTYCGKCYMHRSDLLLHEKVHLNKHEYQCDSCPKSFNTMSHLRSHKLVVHTDSSTWRFECSFCGRRFPIKSNFDRHVRTHTCEKRYPCHLCNKEFSENAYLQRHLLTHTDLRAFKCEHCQKEYKLERVLKVHLSREHGIGNLKVPVEVKKHACSVCDKRFGTKDKLQRHMCTHTGERPFPCPMCEKRFTDKSYVTQHLKTVHNIYKNDND